MADSVRPHRPQPTRLPRPWDSPGKNTGVGCHFLLFSAAAKSLQSCPTLSDPVDCSLPGPSVHGIFQAQVLEWGAIAFSESRLYQALISISTQADTYPLFLFFFLGTEALPREVPWGALGHRHTGDEREGDPRMDCEGTWSEMCTDKEPM